MKSWAAEWTKEGKKVDWQKLLPPRGFEVLPRRWVVERSFAWICHNRRMSKKDYERLCTTGEAFVYVAMTRLLVRRLPVPNSFQTGSVGSSVNRGNGSSSRWAQATKTQHASNREYGH